MTKMRDCLKSRAPRDENAGSYLNVQCELCANTQSESFTLTQELRGLASSSSTLLMPSV